MKEVAFTQWGDRSTQGTITVAKSPITPTTSRFNKHLFVERFDHENRSHGISDLQKAAEEGFSNLVLRALA